MLVMVAGGYLYNMCVWQWWKRLVHRCTVVETLLSFRTKLDDDMEFERKSSEEGPVPGPESVTRTTCRAPRRC